MQNEFDYIVIGAGIAGASVAAHLATAHKVLILEMEDRPGYHTTGRSAASYEPNYGPVPMLALTRASAEFFKNPPSGFADSPLFMPRGSLYLATEGEEAATDYLLKKSDGLEEVSEHLATALLPILRPGYTKRAFLDKATGDLDVDLLHRGYLRQLKAAGGVIFSNAEVTAIEHIKGRWNIESKHGKFTAATVINAAGAWGDSIASMAGVAPVGLVPKRRSIGVVPVAGHPGFERWPMMMDVADTWYAKPQSGKLIVSSADATPVEPHDAYADDMAIAEGIERLMTATTFEVTHLEHSWGGLRTFVPDGNVVAGFDPHTDGFFWFVGQGGYGIQSAPALSRTAAALAQHIAIPADVLETGLNITDIHPQRLR